MFKEIVTKAVIGKGKKYFKNNYNLLAEHNANTILGCWVINHKFKGTVVGDKVVIDGNFDIEKELGIEVLNDAKVKIAIEDDEDPWDTIDDDIEEVDKKIDEEVKEDFI